jgi:hypothetical protein
MSAGFDDRNGWSQQDRRSRLRVMDRDTVFPDRLLRRMLDVLDEARRDDTDDVLPRSVIRGLARLVPGHPVRLRRAGLANQTHTDLPEHR